MDSIKASRDTAKVEAALAALTASANEYDETPDRSSNSHNLLKSPTNMILKVRWTPKKILILKRTVQAEMNTLVIPMTLTISH